MSEVFSNSTNIDDYEVENRQLEALGDLGATGTFNDYLVAIGKHPLLTAEQEVELAKSIEAGLYAQYKLDEGDIGTNVSSEELEDLIESGQAAKKQFVNSNLRLVVSIARRYANHGTLTLPDLIQEGNIGLIRAVEKFDYQKGYKFSTYGTWWIKQSINRGIADKSRPIRLPVHVEEKVRKVNKESRSLTSELGRNPTTQELASSLGWGLELVKDLIEFDGGARAVSLNQLVGGDGDTELGDFVADKGGELGEAALNQMVIGDALNALTSREEMIIRMRFGLDGGKDATLGEVGEELGITKERVRQLQNKALKTLRWVLDSPDSADE